MKKWITLISLICIILFGFWFRIQGIIDNHSFWADEGLLSSYARDIVLGQKSIIQGIQGVWYQPLHILTMAVSFKLFGISEFTARLPSVIFGSIGIIFVYFLAKKLSNTSGGLLAAFLYSFSQLNFANATQAKSYIALQVLFLIEFYLISKIKPKSSFWIHVGIILCITLSTGYQIYALLFILPYVVFLFLQKQYKSLLMVMLFFVCFIFLILQYNPLLLSGLFSNTWYNHIILLKNLLLKQYGLFLLPSLLLFFSISKKEKFIYLSYIAYLLPILFFWNFKQYSHNIRYLVPLFGIIFVFFGVFWGKVGEYISQKSKVPTSPRLRGASESLKLVPFIIIGLLIITQYKIFFPFPTSNLQPPTYFSPNADFYGDVQIADYKTMYQLIRKQVPDYKNIAIFTDLIDAHQWYMPEKKIDAYFMKSNNKGPEKHPVGGGMIYKTFDQFLAEKAKYPKGLLIVEDWESILPEDIKQYAKKNMKRIIRVEGLKEAPNDPWPLEVYEWGLD